MKSFAIFLILICSCAAASAQTSTPALSSPESAVAISPVVPSRTPSDGITEVQPAAKTEPSGSRYVPKTAPVRIPRVEAPPVIDGLLNDPVWRSAAVFGDFLQTQPGDNVPPSSPVEAMMAYDSKNLYIAFNVKQEKGKIRASVARRDNIFEDDIVGVYLDTFNDQRQAYAFFFNPLGIQADGVFQEGRGEDYSVDLVFESKGVVTEDGYTVEVAIPFKSLRYEAGKNKNWGLHIFRRAKYNNNELDSWMPGNRSTSGSLNKAGKITGLEDVSTTRQLEVSPSITLSQSGRRSQYTFNNDPAGRYVNGGIKGDLGVTAKFGLTPTITLDFAYNPDFAQVEADAPVTTANQRFPIFYSEKRPFFLERIDIFRSPINVVNTRSIVDPDVAAKLTGRRGKNTFGLLYASDNAPGNYSPDEREALLGCIRSRDTDPDRNCGSIEKYVDKNANIAVLRFKRDVGRESNIGFFGTSYNFVDRHNYTGGFDGRIRLNPKTVFEFQAVGTNSKRNFYDPDLDKTVFKNANGLAYSAWLERSDRHLYMNFLVRGMSNYYRADVGFTPRTDNNYAGSFVQYTTERNAKRKVIYQRVQNSTNVQYDFKGRSQMATSNSQYSMALHRQTYIGGGYQWAYERVFEHEFGPNRTATRQGAFYGAPERSAYQKDIYAFIETTPVKQFYANVVFDYTFGQMDYDLGAGPRFPRASRAAQLDPNNPLDPGAGNQMMIDATFRYKPTEALQTQLNFTKVRMVRQDTGLTAFDDNIFSSRTTYQFTRSTFARLRMDYSTLNRHMRPQFVVGWTPNPGTAFYVGYNDDMSYNSFNPYTGQHEAGLQRNGHAFFIKASYLFKRSF